MKKLITAFLVTMLLPITLSAATFPDWLAKSQKNYDNLEAAIGEVRWMSIIKSNGAQIMKLSYQTEEGELYLIFVDAAIETTKETKDEIEFTTKPVSVMDTNFQKLQANKEVTVKINRNHISILL